MTEVEGIKLDKEALLNEVNFFELLLFIARE